MTEGNDIYTKRPITLTTTVVNEIIKEAFDSQMYNMFMDEPDFDPSKALIDSCIEEENTISKYNGIKTKLEEQSTNKKEIQELFEEIKVLEQAIEKQNTFLVEFKDTIYNNPYYTP